MAQNEQIPHDPSLEKSLVNLKKECSFYWICTANYNTSLWKMPHEFCPERFKEWNGSLKPEVNLLFLLHQRYTK